MKSEQQPMVHFIVFSMLVFSWLSSWEETPYLRSNKVFLGVYIKTVYCRREIHLSIIESPNLDELLTLDRDIVTWYWSADSFLWQVSIDHNMDRCPISKTYAVNKNCKTWFWLDGRHVQCDFVIVGCTEPRSMPLARLIMKRELHGLLLRDSGSHSYGAPLLRK